MADPHSPPPRDSGASGANGPRDSGASDANGPRDSGASDANGPRDSGASDANGSRDSGASDAKGSRDSGASDAKAPRDKRGRDGKTARSSRAGDTRISRDGKASRDNGASEVKAARDGAAPARTARNSNGNSDDSVLDVVRSWVRALKRSKGGDSVRDALEELIEDREDSGDPIDDHERALLGNILHLRDVAAYDAMIPRADIVAVDDSWALSDLIELFTRCGHSRLPVHRGTLDDIIGMVHIKDVLTATRIDKPFQLHRIVRRVLFVSPAMRVTDLLLEMRLKRTHMALVVDEFGGIDGLVTIEDLVEQIVGEIEDEHDADDEPELRMGADGVIEADARVAIEDFEDEIGLVLSEEEREEVDTLGGLVFFIAGRIPSRGELILHSSGWEFEVLDADPRRIKRLRVRRAESATADQDQ